MDDQREMPRYRCHKEVRALKIKAIAHGAGGRTADMEEETDGGAIIFPENQGYAPFRVEPEYVKKHKPQAGGYYVVYDDGYKSWSPAKAFEEGYTLIV